MKEAENKKTLTINLEEQIIIDERDKSINFKIEAFKKKCLIEGLDDIDLTLKKSGAISIYEEKIQEKFLLFVNFHSLLKDRPSYFLNF